MVDLLPPDHFVSRHIPGAQNACVFQVSFLDDLADAASNKQVPIVVYGASPNSQDAPTALEKLGRAGYEHVSFVKGGPKEWRKAGYDLEGEKPNQRQDPQTMVTLHDGQYKVDTGESRVEWAGRNPNTHHIGTVDIAKGVIEVRDRAVTGKVEIDMNTIRNINLEGDELQPVLVWYHNPSV